MPDIKAIPGVGKTLVSIVGAIAAGLLYTNIPAEESGRKVEVTIAPSGAPTIKHVSGRQYLKAYLDIVGVATACDGITKGVKLGRTYSEAQCTTMLEQALVEHAEGVMACTPGLRVPGRDRQRFAAVDLAYNVGVPKYCASTVARLFNAGQLRAGCDGLMSWVYAGGKRNNGLVNRRTRARTICLQGLA